MATDWGTIEKKWRKRWGDRHTPKATPGTPKKFITVAFPYPNSPQHIGHGRTYTLADVHARFERMRGYNVLFPMAFHYTGTPILGMAERIESKDADLIDTLVNVYNVPRQDIDALSDPLAIAQYFHAEIRSGMIEMGYSIDWTGEFTTIDPAYQKFIAWQVNLLRERGVIVQGSHPVGWCTRDGNPVSQHDTLGDVEPDFVEYVIVHGTLDDGTMLPAATLRPETIHGVTNMWVNPEIEYVRVGISGHTWLVSAECAGKLEHLACGARLLDGSVRGSELLGRNVTIPGIQRSVPILPASFVLGGVGTGAVMSVPAHAPYDYQALADLRGSDGPHAETARGIEPIKILSSEDDSYPAQKAADGAHITNQDDPRLEELTKELYAAEYYSSKMLDNTAELAGMRASEAKTEAAKWLAGIQSKPHTMYEFSNAPIRCRCGTECVVHILENQWFLNYSDEKWKGIARECLSKVEIVPADMRTEFENVIEWLHERACARQKGLGTRVPWDENWIVESLSDSVIYMAYYVISRFVVAKRMSADTMDDSLFDYVFLGKGDVAEVAASCGADAGTLQDARAEFAYFYPVDARHSGRDLVPNHLSFFIFNHAMIFPREHWPRQIVVNGSVLMDGKKMSKSMNNIIPLRQAVREYGADPIRLAIMTGAELLQDADFKLELVRYATAQLESMMRECSKIAGTGAAESESPEDLWLAARMREASADVAELVQKMRLREAVRYVISEIDTVFAWHSRRAAAAKRNPSPAVRRAWGVRTTLLSPFAPHAADEMSEILGNSPTASESAWPKLDPHDKDANLFCSETLLESVMEDIRRILSVIKIEPKKITLYIAAPHKRVAYGTMLAAANDGSADMKSMMKVLGENESTEQIRRDPKFVNNTLADILSTTSRDRRIRGTIGGFEESKLYESELRSLISHELGAELAVYAESDPDKYDPKNKAKMARVFKPAILIE